MRNPIPSLLSPSVAGGMFLFLLLTACGQQNSFPDDNALYDMEVEEEIIPITRQAEVVPPPPSFSETGDDQDPADEVVKSLIIRQGDMEIEVKEVEKAKAGLDVLVQTHKGYYSNEQYQDAWNRLSYTLSIRIPSDRFEAFVKGVEEGEGRIVSKQITARDVTEEYLDLELRQKNILSFLKRYNEMLKQARNVEEMLQIQKRIDELENGVERVVGRLKFLNDRVKYSTLNIEIYQHIKHEKAQVEEDGFFTRLWEGLTKGWDRFLNFIIGLATNWSLFLILAVIVYFVMKLWRRRKGRK